MRDIDTTRGAPREPAFTPSPEPATPPKRRGRSLGDWLAIPAHMGGRCFCGGQCANPTDPSLRGEP